MSNYGNRYQPVAVTINPGHGLKLPQRRGYVIHAFGPSTTDVYVHYAANVGSQREHVKVLEKLVDPGVIEAEAVDLCACYGNLSLLRTDVYGTDVAAEAIRLALNGTSDSIAAFLNKHAEEKGYSSLKDVAGWEFGS